MNKQVCRYIFFLLICFWGFAIPKSFAQSIEEAYDLQFQATSYFQSSTPYLVSIDSTQLTEEGFYPLRLKYKRLLDDWAFSWSRTVVLPVNAEKKESCTVTLNCKSEIDSLRFVVIFLDKEENALHVDSVIIHPSNQWTDYSLSLCREEARAVNIIIRHKRDFHTDFGKVYDAANDGRSIYLNKLSIRLGNQNLNTLPIDSLVHKDDTQLNPQAIVPLSKKNGASLFGIKDWKDKKIISLGEPISGVQDILDAQIQFTKYLITSENCKLIFLELPQELCLRWNLYLQGKQVDIDENKLIEEVNRSLRNPTVFFEFLKWIRQYNATVSDPVRVVGIIDCGSLDQRTCLADYLLKFATNRQDSVYYLNASKDRSVKNSFSNFKEHILQSKIPGSLNEKDLCYLLSLIEEWKYRNRTLKGAFGGPPDYVSDQTRRIKQAVDIYLPSTEKAVIMAPSARINKCFPISDLDEVEVSRCKFDRLGSYLVQEYGKQYHAISFQIGERTCRMDNPSRYEDNGYSVEWKPPFPFSFEQAAKDSEVPYFYYPSDQLPDGILGLNLFTRARCDIIPFRYCHIPFHFDALVFIRDTKAIRDEGKYYDYELDKYLENILDINKLLEELKE